MIEDRRMNKDFIKRGKTIGNVDWQMNKKYFIVCILILWASVLWSANKPQLGWFIDGFGIIKLVWLHVYANFNRMNLMNGNPSFKYCHGSTDSIDGSIDHNNKHATFNNCWGQFVFFSINSNFWCMHENCCIHTQLCEDLNIRFISKYYIGNITVISISLS